MIKNWLLFFIFFQYIKSTHVIKILTMQKFQVFTSTGSVINWARIFNFNWPVQNSNNGWESWDRRGRDITQSRQQKQHGYFLVAKLKLKLVMWQYSRWMDHTDRVYFSSSCEWELIAWHHKTHRKIQCTIDLQAKQLQTSFYDFWGLYQAISLSFP